MDKLSEVLDEVDFQRIYTKVKADRIALEQRLSQLDRPDYSPAEQVDLAKNWWSGSCKLPPPTGNCWSVSSSRLQYPGVRCIHRAYCKRCPDKPLRYKACPGIGCFRQRRGYCRQQELKDQ